MSSSRQVRGEKRFYVLPPMRKLQQELDQEKKSSEDLLLTKSSKSVREYAKPIPVDLLIEIFSRVPAKSLARFRCVSKFWESILVRHDFTEVFLTRSVALPRLLLIAKVDEKLLVFSSPNPHNPKHNSSFVATRYKNFPKYFPTDQISRPACGLVFSQYFERKARVICNPATGESITLPKVKATGIGKSYFGFDPISKQFKVLCMTWSRYGTPNTHRVLTLKTGKRIWRSIQDPVLPHIDTFGNGICINGVLYYRPDFEGSYKADFERCNKIVCFDFRFEKFSFVNTDEEMWVGCQWDLFNNKGKLGVYVKTWYTKEVALWVLEDAGKHIWSKRIILLPNIVNMYNIVGMTGTGEIVFSPCGRSNPFHIFYYNIESNTLTVINIKGIHEEFKDHPISIRHVFLDYVENMIKFI